MVGQSRRLTPSLAFPWHFSSFWKGQPPTVPPLPDPKSREAPLGPSLQVDFVRGFCKMVVAALESRRLLKTQRGMGWLSGKAILCPDSPCWLLLFSRRGMLAAVGHVLSEYKQLSHHQSAPLQSRPLSTHFLPALFSLEKLVTMGASWAYPTVSEKIRAPKKVCA